MDLTRPPYYDDFDPQKSYTRILAVPGRVNQARETTQIQTMLQNQIARLGSLIYGNGTILSGCILAISEDKLSVTISPGSVFSDGIIIEFVNNVSVDITGVGTEVVGIIKDEQVITETSDPSLKDPAVGFENYNEPGSHRLKEVWSWSKIYDEGIGIFILKDGALPIQNKKDPAIPKITSQIENVLDIIARRDFQKSGNYLLDGLKCSLLEHPVDKFTKKQLVVSAGTARILGYDITFTSDIKEDINIASDVIEILNEPKIYTPYNPSNGSGASYRLGQRPVAYVDRVTAIYLVVDGEGGRSSVTRGGTPGGSDELSDLHVVSVVAVNQGGTWNPVSESFVGGTTYPTTSYRQDGNRIDWSLVGLEPSGGSSYKVAYKCLLVLTKEIVSASRVVNELIVHGDSAGNNLLDNTFVCEKNNYTPYSVLLSNLVSPVPDPDDPGFLPDYVQDVDFSITDLGEIDWYNHQLQVLEITKGSSNGIDAITGFLDSYTMGDIIDVAHYADPQNVNFDRVTNKFVSTSTSYIENVDYRYSKGIAQIDWSLGGHEPVNTSHYYIAVKARNYKTSNHPVPGGRYYSTYHYWNVEVPGDYLSRDSFFVTWIGAGSIGNVPQVFGLNLQDYVNFHRSSSYNSGIGNYNRPYPNTLVEIDYRYYLPRYVLIGVNLDDPIKIIYGESSDNPSEPFHGADPGNLIIAKIYCPAQSLDMVLTNLGVQTLKVVDLHGIRDRIIRTEENLALTWLDMDAKSIPISNKKGIMTTSFTDNERLDAGWLGSTYSIDPKWEELAMPHSDSFYSLFVDEELTTATIYENICSMVSSGEDIIEQTSYTGDESIAPYALAGQGELEKAQTAYMTLSPSGDTLIIPRLQEFSSQEDADTWVASDIFKLSNPSMWFSKGWTGETVERDYGQYGIQTTESENQRETLTTSYIRDIQGNCRQIEVSFKIPAGLVSTEAAELDFFIYFGGTLVTPTLTGGTPVGSATGSFRPILATGGAQGTFMIPPNIPEGRVEVKVMSTPMNLNGNVWRQVIIAIFDASVVEQLTMQFNRCRCNCWCWCNCNCWACRGRCGTGPLAETLEPIGKYRVLKSVDIDFSKVHPVYGVYACLVTTDNGQPTSNTISSGMIARKFLNASQLAGAGMKKYVFDDPIFMKDECYAIVITGEDGFNINSISEITAGKDIRCKIATLGKKDLLTNITVGTQPFKNGILWRSLTGVTWEQDQKSDLKFKATFNLYPTNRSYYVYMNDLSVVDATAFLCTWNSEMYDGTKINFEYKTPNGKWTEFSPYTLIRLEEVSDLLKFRAKLSTLVSNVSPFCSKFAGLYVQSQGTELKVVTKNFNPGEPSDICDIYLDSHLSIGCEQHIGITFDNGISWVDLNNSVDGNVTGNLLEYLPVDLNIDNVKYRHHWRLTLGSPNTYSSVRVGIVCNVTGSEARLRDPRFSRLVVIASNS